MQIIGKGECQVKKKLCLHGYGTNLKSISVRIPLTEILLGKVSVSKNGVREQLPHLSRYGYPIGWLKNGF